MNNLGATERRANTSKNWNFFFLRGNTDIHACARDHLARVSRQREMNRDQRRQWARGYFGWGFLESVPTHSRMEAMTSGVVWNDQKEGQ